MGGTASDGDDDGPGPRADEPSVGETRSGPPDGFGSAYRLLSGAVVPRPIAWVSSRGPAGENLAPYSFFTVVAVDPPTLLFAPVATAADPKDSLANALETGAFAVSVVTLDLVEAMNESAATTADSEFERAGVTPVDCDLIDAPRIAEAGVTFECELSDHVEVGGSTAVFGEVVRAHVDPALLTSEGEFDVRELDAVGRLAGSWYATTRDRFRLERPP